MSDGAAFLTDRVFGDTAVRHWVLSLPPPLRYHLAYDASLLGEVVGVFVHAVFRFLRRKAKDELGLQSVTQAHPGAVTVVQRFSGNLALNVHFHSLVTDGVFVEEGSGGPVTFHELPGPTEWDVTDVAWETCRRVRDVLIRRGLWRDHEDDGLEDPLVAAHPGLAGLYRASMCGVLSLGPHRGQRVVRFFGRAAPDREEDPAIRRAGNAFDLHARQAVASGKRRKLERLARYVLRPPLAQGRLSRGADGRVVVHLKRPWRDGTLGMVFEPLDFLGKLAALIPHPRMNTIRFHGVYAAHARLRDDAVAIVPEQDPADACRCPTDDTRRRPGVSGYLMWAELLARVFRVDVFECPRCGCRGMQRIAWILDPAVIRRILGSVGLATDGPVPHPPRSCEGVFGEAPAA